MKLILGTREFGSAYGEGVQIPPSNPEIIKILNLAWESGIRTLDTADTYGTEGVEKYFGEFDRLFKSRTIKDAWYHYQPYEPPLKGIKKASVYTREQLADLDNVVIPLNIHNTEFVGVKAPIVYIRSIFDRGKLLAQGYSVKDCLSFVKRHNPQGVIVGVNSLKELEEILSVW